MDATETKTKPKASPKSKSKRAGKPLLPWTDDQVQILMDCVASSPTVSAGIRTAAQQLGKNEGAVSQKFYNLKNRGKRAKKAAPYRATSGESQFSNMSTSELVHFAERIRSEIDRRRKELDAAHDLFN